VRPVDVSVAVNLMNLIDRKNDLALQLHYLWTSESMVYHDSDEVMDDWFVNREHA
jgi:hypothetical protein